MRWIRTTKANPCKICGRTKWCCVLPNGDTLCTKVSSRIPLHSQSGDLLGYVHGSGKLIPELPVMRRKPAKTKNAEMNWLAFKYRNNLTSKRLQWLSNDLSISQESLIRLGVGHDNNQCYSFPMRNANDLIVGIRLRNKQGQKFSVTGSQQGLFIPDGIRPLINNTLYICEGPTDCGALLDLGLSAIGRPNATSCVQMTIDYIPAECRVILVADNDPIEIMENGGIHAPGMFGSLELARNLLQKINKVGILMPKPYKDARDFLKSGKTLGDFQALEQAGTTWLSND